MKKETLFGTFTCISSPPMYSCREDATCNSLVLVLSAGEFPLITDASLVRQQDPFLMPVCGVITCFRVSIPYSPPPTDL